MHARSLFSAAVVFVSGFTSASAATVIVNFGSDATNTNGYNAVTSTAGLSTTPISLLDTTGNSAGLTLSFTGATGTYAGAVNGINNAIAFSTATGDAWTVRSGGKDIADVTTKGLCLDFRTVGSMPTFTLSGLEIGKEYSLMLLMGATSTGNGNMWVNFEGIANSPMYSYTGFDSAVGKTATYTGSNSTLRFATLYGNAGKGGLDITFTAASTELEISMGGLGYQSGIQGLALTTPIPEPSTYALGAAGLLGALALIRRRRK